MKCLCTPLAVAALAVGLTACGGGGKSPDSTQAGTQPSSQPSSSGSANGSGQGRPATTSGSSAAQAAAERKARAKVKLGSPAEVRRSKRGDNSIQDFGREASDPERAAAARALAVYLAAYRSRDTQTACELLSAPARERLQRLATQAGSAAQGGEGPKGCPQVLEALTVMLPSLPRQARRQLTIARILSLRVNGDRAFAIWKAADDKTYAILMMREADGWHVGGFVGTPLLP